MYIKLLEIISAGFDVLHPPLNRERFSIRQILVYADDANLLGDNINTVKKNTALADANKEAGL
jgi:hypothetical protein